MKDLSRKEFKELFADKLEKNLGFKFYWNGKEANKKGLNSNGYLGRSYTSYKDRPIVLTYRKNNDLEMFSTLIHEYAHSYLHYQSKLHKIEKEIEAETVAEKVFEKFNIELERHNKYIKRFKDKYIILNNKKFKFTKKREQEINNLVEKIFIILSPEKEKISLLRDKKKNEIKKRKVNKVKYEIVCKECGKVVAHRITLKGAISCCEKYLCGLCKSKLEYREIGITKEENKLFDINGTEIKVGHMGVKRYLNGECDCEIKIMEINYNTGEITVEAINLDDIMVLEANEIDMDY